MKKYIANHIPNHKLGITGKADDSLWKSGHILTDFGSPWSPFEGATTQFRALWDDENLYFMFEVEDAQIYIDQTRKGYDSVNISDRVELFFRQDDSLNPYYCLEMDPTPRIMDFRAFPGRVFDFDWNWPEGNLVVKSHTHATGFTVEGKISLQSLKALNLIQNDTIETGIFRAKFVEVGSSIREPIWISWVTPKSETPNFHIASSFGLLILKR